MSVQELESAVSSLPPEEFARFQAWFEEFAADAWDRQIEADARSGRLDALYRSLQRENEGQPNVALDEVLDEESFRSRLATLPSEVRSLAYKNFRLWLRDPHHPSIRFKPVGRFWSARVGSNFRALAVMDSEHVEWFWIGTHDEYERIIRSP